MDIVGSILACIGVLAYALANIWILICAFRKSILWGLICLLPFASIVYLFVDWPNASKPFLTGLAGIFIAVTGIGISPSMQKAFTSGSASGGMSTAVENSSDRASSAKPGGK